jgi:hypothetical protein
MRSQPKIIIHNHYSQLARDGALSASEEAKYKQLLARHEGHSGSKLSSSELETLRKLESERRGYGSGTRLA